MNNFFRNLKTKHKLWIIVGTSIIGLIITLLFLLLNMRDRLYTEKDIKTRQLVESAYGVLDYFNGQAKSGKMTDEEAKQAALSVVKNMRYEGREYFWINSDQMPPVMIMHPTMPALDGKPLTDAKYNCATSMKAGLDGEVRKTDGKKNLFEAMVTVADEKGQGFVAYQWPKPLIKDGHPVVDENGKPKVTEQLYEKKSFVKKFEPWGWIIGSGIYIDDVNTFFIQHLIKSSIIAFTVIVLISLVSWLVARGITAPLSAISTNVEQVANGDLTVRLDNSGKDEISALSSNVNRMVSSFNSMIGAILSEAENVGLAVDTLKIAATKTASGASEQSGQAHQIATAAEEMSQTIIDIAKNAAVASESSVEAMEIAENGKKITDITVETINEVNVSTAELAGLVNKLDARVIEIGSILTVIKEIADQTNLLALNAAIEAARAGEQGRGFAVVADEVRKLAEKTIKATTEISERINAVQQESVHTMQSMERSSSGVKKATGHIQNLNNVLESIVESVQQVRDQITQIATAVDEQSAASEEVARNIEKTSAISKDMETMAEEVMKDVEKLTGISGELRNSTSGFRV
ncbi:MAG: methyl-accepting chemotaxis protein [Nitrospirae bacterium]|nr:methyl-accepting chemotaxis protein [Nitrospirota bacterium]